MLGLIRGETRPDRLRDTSRDEKYHADWGRYIISTSFDQLHINWLEECQTNRLFYKNDQWCIEEDLETFLKDETGESRNRVRVTNNKIVGIVEQYRGNAIIMDICARAESVSYQAINRRESQLAELLYWTEAAKQNDGINQQLADDIRGKFPIGKDATETIKIFDSVYRDAYVQNINHMMEYVSKENKFKDRQPELALDMALSGLGCMKYVVHNGDFRWIRKMPETLFWDRTAIEPDLTDAEFMGDWEYMTASEIFEKYQDIRPEVREAIESGISSNNNSWVLNGKMLVYNMYFKDFVEYYYGYVKDEYGYEHLVRIDYKEEGEDSPRYTKDDVIPYKDLNESQKKLVGKSGIKKLYVDLMRYVSMIPSEIIGYLRPDGSTGDIVLEYGILPYQDTDYYNLSSVGFPYKIGTWIYYGGAVQSPVSYLINPQRMINRFGSVLENIVNNAKASNVFYDKDALGRGGEDELLSNLRQSKPIGVHAKMRGINNAIAEYNPKMDNAMIYDALSRMMSANIDGIIGVNGPLRGEANNEQLVGVQQLQIQRASLIQEPFYNAIANIYLQMYQTTANVGKRVFADNDRKLAIMVGDQGAKVIKITKEYVSEAFRVFIERSGSYKQQVGEGNKLALMLLQMGLLDANTFSKLFNNSTTSDVSIALREYTKMKSYADSIAQQQQEVVQQQQQQVAAGAIQSAKQEDDNKFMIEQGQKSADREASLMSDLIKVAGNNANQQQVPGQQQMGAQPPVV